MSPSAAPVLRGVAPLFGYRRFAPVTLSQEQATPPPLASIGSRPEVPAIDRANGLKDKIGKGDDSPLQPIPQLHPKDAAGSALVQGVNAELGVFELAEPRKTNTGEDFTGAGR
jgi:hypothetical protein